MARVQVYNTLGRSLQPFRPRIPGEVTIYTCGPTVQAAPHVGHGRQAVAFDVIRRYLEWRGYRVTYVTNVTDIEDKIINAAADQGISTEEVAARATEQFLDAYRLLGVRPPDRLCYATREIPRMLDLIGRLVEKGHAYPAGGSVYFAVRSFPDYGKLSGRDPDELLAGTRFEPGEEKREPADFALWKASKPGEPSWDSPWGPGRPGWHIECSAMAEGELGFGFDIHGGGLDLVFPHHENEIAQSEAAAGSAPFARYWLHNGMLNLSGEKMSKSTGMVVGLNQLLEEYPPLAVRLYYLRAHYRAPLDFSEGGLADAAASLERLWAFRRRAGSAGTAAPGALALFTEAMDDDFNTAEAMAVLFDLVREGNRRLDAGEDAGEQAAAYDEIMGVLGLAEPAAGLDDLAGPLAGLAAAYGLGAEGPSAAVDALIARRAQARREAAWALGDEIRDGLGELGILLEDGPDGTVWRRR
ncbi:MAG: cysteine--tRNA ligase [Actinobacteria bacterium RBG_16_70_17]|nr:MAG: cysteine--tRNA ligase [Actinobacteria bacterium RBG_16_70_17]